VFLSLKRIAGGGGKKLVAYLEEIKHKPWKPSCKYTDITIHYKF